jgi:hypothetical protein
MTLCTLCQFESWQVSASGFCEEPMHHANFYVCEHPNLVRNDQWFHGERCGCGCNRLYCKDHIYSHSASHGSAAPSCFSNIASLYSSSATAGASAQLASNHLSQKDAERARVDVTEFLCRIKPGEDKMGSALLHRGLEKMMPRPVKTDHEKELPPAFFTKSRLLASALAAFHVLGAAIRHGVTGRATNEKTSQPGLKQALSEVAKWHGPDSVPSSGSLAIIAKESWRGNHQQLDWKRASDSIRAAMAKEEVPEDDDALAHWITAGIDEKPRGLSIRIGQR